MSKLMQGKRYSVLLTGFVLACATSVQAGVVVVVGANSGVSHLTKSQVADIYLGKLRDLPSGGVAMTSMLSSSPSKDDFLDKILGKTEQQARATWARLTFTGSGTGPKEIGTPAEIKKLLAGNANVIGTLDKADVDAQVKVVFEP